MAAQTYWISKTFVADWALKLLDNTPASTATVTGVVTLPSGTTVAMAATWVAADLVWRLTYDPTVAGLHAWRANATGTADSAEEGHFVVQTSLVGADPIELDPTTVLGLTRLFATDINESNPILTDAQWSGLITACGGSARLAAAQGLEAIAVSELLISKVIVSQDLSVDGSKVAAELRALAAVLRQQVDDGWGNSGLEDSSFAIVDFNPNAWIIENLLT